MQISNAISPLSSSRKTPCQLTFTRVPGDAAVMIDREAMRTGVPTTCGSVSSQTKPADSARIEGVPPQAVAVTVEW
eukprot:4525572-Prymnesium_polylepis.3